MSQITLTLKAIDELISEHSRVGSTDGVRLLQTLRGFYDADSDLETLTAIPDEEISKRLSLEIKQIESLKISLNVELRSLVRENLNPHAIRIGPKNTFVQHTEPEPAKESRSAKSSAASAEPHRAFKVSEMTFNMPEELRNEFQTQIDRLKEQEKTANEKVRELLEKEKNWEQEKLRMEKESSEFRAKMQAQRETMQKQFDEERKRVHDEIQSLHEEISKNHQDLEALREQRAKSLEEFETEKSRLTQEYSRHDEVFQGKFDEMSELMVKLAAQEKDFFKRQESEHKKMTAKEKRLARTATEQAKATATLNAQTKALNAERKKLKKRMKDELQEKLRELQKDFARRSEYHITRVEEFEQEEIRLNQEKEKLRVKEQHLTLDAQARAEERVKAKYAELESFQKELEEKQNQILEQEEELLEEKETLLEDIKGMKKLLDAKQRPTLVEFNNLLMEQETIIKNRRALEESISSLKQTHEDQFNKKLQKLDEEQKEIIEKINAESSSLLNENQRLKELEKDLLRREAKELERLNAEFEEIKNSFEVEQIEKEMEFDEKENKLFDKEESIIDKQSEIALQEKESAKRIAEQEAEALKHAQEIAEMRENLAAHQEEVKAFLAEVKDNFSDIVQVQGKEYESFKERISSMEEEAQRLTQFLKEKEKNVLEKTSATEVASKERLKQRESMVDLMEKELRERVQEYNHFVKELADVKLSMQSADEERQAELRESLMQYEEKLSHLGEAFEDLSEAFHREKDAGNIEVAPERDEKQSLEYDEALAKAEWPLAIRHRLGLTAGERAPHITEYIYNLSENWAEWIRIPSGTFQMGNKDSRESAPYQQQTIEKPFLIGKYPVTNIEFYRFVNETDYKSEAQNTITAIAYHKGEVSRVDVSGKRVQHSFTNPTLAPEKRAFWLRPDGENESLHTKFHHPVTQVTWNDAQAYCRWKSEQVGKVVRLPTEAEWEYVASNLGKASTNQFFWTPEEVVHFCNIDESRIFETTPVDHYPEHQHTCGVMDLYGNVFEWVQDSHRKNSASGLEYKIARGGSFITLYKHIAHWRRLAFLKSYCTSFLGFRTVCEED